MTRKLKENTCKACGYTFVAKDRNYKSTCSGSCSARISIRTAVCQAVVFGNSPIKVLTGMTLELIEFEERYSASIYKDGWSKFKG